jgi:hypothetical protein
MTACIICSTFTWVRGHGGGVRRKDSGQALDENLEVMLLYFEVHSPSGSAENDINFAVS